MVDSGDVCQGVCLCFLGLLGFGVSSAIGQPFLALGWGVFPGLKSDLACFRAEEDSDEVYCVEEGVCWLLVS